MRINYKDKIRAISVLLTIVIVSCKPSIITAQKSLQGIKSFELLGNDIYPEGICIDTENGTIYTGSINGKGIQKTLHGNTKYLLKPSNSFVSDNILGMAVDDPNNRLWVCSNNLGAFFQNQSGEPKLSILNTDSGKLIRSIEKKDFSPDFNPLFGDVVTDSKGNAYVTNLASTAIIKVSDDFSEIEVWEDFPKAPDGKFYILNGLDVSANGENLIVATYKTGYEGALATLFKVNTKNGDISEIDCNDSVEDFKINGIDGLAFVNDSTLVGVSGNGKLLRISMSNNLTKATIQVISTGTKAESILLEPSTVALFDGKLYTTNSQANRFFSGKPPSLPFMIMEIPLDIIGLNQ